MSTKVLVFESDADFAQTLVKGLLAYGCETTVVSDGEEGIAVAAAKHPDLILLTIELPRMNGFSVCNKLKRDAELKKVPLVLLSSEATEETFDQHKRLRTRADEYVHKPVTVDALVKKLSAIVPLTKVGGDDADDAEEVTFDEDVEIEEVDMDDESELESETDEAFGNLIVPEEKAPPADEVVMDDLELDEGDGLELAPEEPPPAPEARPAPPQVPALAVDTRASEALQDEVNALNKKVSQLELDLKSSRDATLAEAAAKAQVIQKKDAEISLAEKEIEALKSKMESKEGAGTAREFLDLREQLNKKDKEILDIKDRLSSKEKEVVRLNDDNISLGRTNADVTDQNAILESEKALAIKERDAATADKMQASKRGDDYKAKSEKFQTELDAKSAQHKQAVESHENAMATRDAQDAATRDDHAKALRDAAAAAESLKQKAVATAISETEEKAAGERESALVAAAEQAKRALGDALVAREAELKAEQDSKMAALHRANEESLRKLRAEHEQASVEATQVAADRLAARERALADENDAALAAQKATLDAEMAAVEGQRAALASDLSTRTSERDQDRATIEKREQTMVVLEANLASLRAEVVELGDKLAAESAKLGKAREKWSADEQNLRTAKDAFEVAAREISEALSRPSI